MQFDTFWALLAALVITFCDYQRIMRGPGIKPVSMRLRHALMGVVAMLVSFVVMDVLRHANGQ